MVTTRCESEKYFSGTAKCLRNYATAGLLTVYEIRTVKTGRNTEKLRKVGLTRVGQSGILRLRDGRQTARVRRGVAF